MDTDFFWLEIHIYCDSLLCPHCDTFLSLSLRYWETLHANGIDAERLLSYDRSIHSEPKFNEGQVEGLVRDLKKYMLTLKAVHSGADLESAAAYVLGYSIHCTESYPSFAPCYFLSSTLHVKRLFQQTRISLFLVKVFLEEL